MRNAYENNMSSLKCLNIEWQRLRAWKGMYMWKQNIKMDNQSKYISLHIHPRYIPYYQAIVSESLLLFDISYNREKRIFFFYSFFLYFLSAVTCELCVYTFEMVNDTKIASKLSFTRFQWQKNQQACVYVIW